MWLVAMVNSKFTLNAVFCTARFSKFHLELVEAKSQSSWTRLFATIRKHMLLHCQQRQIKTKEVVVMQMNEIALKRHTSIARGVANISESDMQREAHWNSAFFRERPTRKPRVETASSDEMPVCQQWVKIVMWWQFERNSAIKLDSQAQRR